MIHEEREEIRITGRSPEWQAVYSWDRFDGPLTLTVDGLQVVTQCNTRFDDLTEELVVVDQCKAYRKGHGAMVGKEGRMPIGAETTYKFTHRYSNNALKVVKDFFIPRGLEVEREAVVDALRLDGGFLEYRELSDALELGNWTAIGDGVVWPAAPVAICLKHSTGMVVEIGRGNDLWRWNDGFLPEGGPACGAELKRDEDGLTLCRYGAQVTESTPLTPRSFRFSWYLAWSAEHPSQDDGGLDTVTLTHRPNGDVAMGALAESLKANPESAIQLDVTAISIPDSLKSNGTGGPCFTSNQTIKRLKRVIRQLSGLRTDGAKRLVFKNLRPEICTVGHHVHGKVDRIHWDMISILDFALWTCQTLGEDWVLINDPVLELPSLMGAFLPTDHQDYPIQYEYTPDTP